MARLDTRVATSLITVLITLPLQLVGQQPTPSTLPFMNPSLPVDQRVDDLIGRMTLEEKEAQPFRSSLSL